MRKLLLTAFSILAAASVYAQTQGSVLAQLGARGVTKESDGTSDYRNYLVLLNDSGKLDASLLDTSGGVLSVPSLNNLYYIDINGTNAADAGSIVKPFRTLEYALSQITTNSILIFSPGVHTRASTAITNPDITHLVLVGYDAETTIIDGAGNYSLAFNNSLASKIDMAGITVDKINQENNVATVINAYSGAILNNVGRVYPTLTPSHVTLYADPVSSVPVVPDNSTSIESHAAPRLGYTPASPTHWDPSPTTVQQGLDILASYHKLNVPTNIGVLLYWDGSGWVNTGTGTTEQVLFGGISPTFQNLVLAGEVTGSYLSTVIEDESITTNKLSAALQARIAGILSLTNEFSGDVVGTYNSNTVIRLQGKAIPIPDTTNDQMYLVYDMASDEFIFIDGIAVSNWADYPAIQDIDVNDFNLTNVAGIVLGGVYRTNWPTVDATSEDWSGWAATQTVDMAEFGITNIYSLTLGGVTITNWADTGDWALTPAVQDVDIDNHNLTNVFGLTLGGDYRTNWPDISTWYNYVAGTNVDLNNFSLTNVTGITLGGVYLTSWPDVGSWYNYVAGTNVDLNNFSLTNVTGITLGGDYRTNWPDISTWAQYAALQNVDLAANELTNVFAITLGGTRRTTWPVGTGGDTWSQHPATTDVNIASNLLLGVEGMQLGGDMRTAWPTASNWATYPASDNVNIAGHGLQQVQFMTLGGVTRTTWPIEVTDWYSYPAQSIVDLGTNALTNVTAITLNGDTIVVWPVSATEWAAQTAITNVDMDSFNIDNIGELNFAGWSVHVDGAGMVFSNASGAFRILDSGQIQQSAGAADKYVMVSSPDGTGIWTNELTLHTLNVTNTFNLPEGAQPGYIWTATNTDGKGYWAQYATVSITNEADPVAMAELSNYYWTAAATETFITNSYMTTNDLYNTFSELGHDHDGIYSFSWHNHDLWYAHKNHLHEGVYSPTNHNHYGMYISGAMSNTWAPAISNWGVTPQYNYMLYYVNGGTTYWGPAPTGGGGTNWGTNHVSSLAVGPQYMETPEIVSIYQADGAAINVAATHLTNVQTSTRSPNTGVNRDNGDPATDPGYGAVIDALYANIADSDGIRTLNMYFDLPDLSYVYGLEVSVRYRRGSLSSNATCYVLINNNGYISETNSFNMTATSDTTVTLGSSTSVWGLTSIDGGPLAGWDVNQNDFSVEIFTEGGPGNSYLIDGVIVKAYYTHHIMSYDMGVTTDAEWYLRRRGYSNVLEATGNRLRIPYGASSSTVDWVLTCIDEYGTVQWEPAPGVSTSSIPSAILLSGAHTPTGLVNTVTFTNTFTSGAPTVVAGWLNSDIDEIAVVNVLSSTNNSFDYQIINSMGTLNTNWIIGWIASDPVLLAGTAEMSTWSTQPAIQNVNMNAWGLNNLSYIQLGTNAPITQWPNTRNVSFALQYPQFDDEITVWRAPHNIQFTRLSGIISGGTGTEVSGRLEWYTVGEPFPEIVVSNVVIGVSGVTLTTFDRASNPANGWLHWVTTNVVGDVGQIAITLDYVAE